MGKKKKKFRKSYNKKQFENIMCSSCRVCSGNATGPEFCYNLYKEDADLFLAVIYKKLVTIEEWPWTIKQDIGGVTNGVMSINNMSIQGTSNKFIETAVFRNIYCRAGICNTSDENNCPMLSDCLIEFKRQTGRWGEPEPRMISGAPTMDTKRYKKQLKNRRKAMAKAAKRKAKYICNAYPTFFTNNREGWVAQIEEILTNGDANIEQIKVAESS